MALYRLRSNRKLLGARGACPREEESAKVNHSRPSLHGNRHRRRILNQPANAAVKLKGSIFQILCDRYVPRLGHKQTIGIIAHKLCRLVWKILQRGIRYEERGPEVSKASKQKRTRKMIREHRRLGYRIETEPFSISHHSMIAISDWHDSGPASTLTGILDGD